MLVGWMAAYSGEVDAVFRKERRGEKERGDQG